MSNRKKIIYGMASLLWADAWGNHADGHQCVNLSGKQVEDFMPPVPKEAFVIAEKWAKKIESKNHASLDKLYDRAMDANEKEGRGAVNDRVSLRSTPDAFG